MVVVRAVREIQPEDVDPGVDQLAQHFGRPRRRADGGDDLRADPAMRLVVGFVGHRVETFPGKKRGASAPGYRKSLARRRGSG